MQKDLVQWRQNEKARKAKIKANAMKQKAYMAKQVAERRERIKRELRVQKEWEDKLVRKMQREVQAQKLREIQKKKNEKLRLKKFLQGNEEFKKVKEQRKKAEAEEALNKAKASTKGAVKKQIEAEAEERNKV